MRRIRNGQRTRRLHLVLTCLGMVGIAALFLPFAYDVSPWSAAFDGWVWRAGVPAFLSLPVAAASLRLLRAVPLSAPEKLAAYLVAGAAAAVSLSTWWESGVPSGIQERIGLGLPILILVVGALLLVRAGRAESSRQAKPIVALQVPYVAHAAMYVVMFIGDLQAGAYCVGFTAVVFSAQTLLLSSGAFPPGEETAERATLRLPADGDGPRGESVLSIRASGTGDPGREAKGG